MSVDNIQNNSHGPEHPQSVGYTLGQKIKLFPSPTSSFYQLEAGGILPEVILEYETYGQLNSKKDNAILVMHALTGDAHAAGWDKNPQGLLKTFRKNRPGWWDTIIGPGKPLDTNKYYIICANILGSCYGSTGPGSINPKTNKPYALDFPVVTVGDWVKLQMLLLDHLGIDVLDTAIGGSVGGQQVLELCLAYPERIKKAIILAAGYRITAQGLGFNSVGRQAILADPNFNNGNYCEQKRPTKGLAAARMLAHITYLSEEGMMEKFGRRLQDKNNPDFTLTGVEFEIESYLNHQGKSFVQRFDANSYLYITRAMDYYDAAEKYGDGNLAQAAEIIKAQLMVVAFSSDWLFPPKLCRKLVSAMCQAGKPVSYINIPTRYGHDAFLIETDTVGRLIKSFL